MKIGDFSLSNNLGYSKLNHNELYYLLIPPECKLNYSNFSKPGDVYFFGWILVELVLQDSSLKNIEEELQAISSVLTYGNDFIFKELIFQTLHQVFF